MIAFCFEAGYLEYTDKSEAHGINMFECCVGV